MVPDPSEAPGTRRTFQDVFGPLATRIVRRTPCFRKVYIIKMARQSAKPLREIKQNLCPNDFLEPLRGNSVSPWVL